LRARGQPDDAAPPAAPDASAGHEDLDIHVTVGQRIINSGFLDRFHSRHPGIAVELIMEQRALDLSRAEADIAIRGGGADDGSLVGRKIADLPWAIFASAAFVDRHGRPNSPAELARFSVVEFTDDLASLPAARWMKSHAPDARITARCSNVPSVHLAIKSGAGLAPLPAVYASADSELVNLIGPIPELDYPIFLLAQGRQAVAEGECCLRILCAGVEAGADAWRDEAVSARRPLTSLHRAVSRAQGRNFTP
jgi:DNA-binding transcriptional LysR family regulator